MHRTIYKNRGMDCGSGFDSAELVAGQPRSGFNAAKEIAAGKPLPHLKIRRSFGLIVLGIARQGVHLNFVDRTKFAVRGEL